jgi:hypothetical protein
MKIKILMLCAVLSLGVGCKKENSQIDRYKIFSTSWEELVAVKLPDGQMNFSTIDSKKLIKIDSVTGRVWQWARSVNDTNDISGWVEMTDSGLVLPPSFPRSQKH